MNILQKIKELNLPSDQYVIIGSGTMDVLGIREAQDIDISVTKELFNKIKESGEWEEYEKKVLIPMHNEYVEPTRKYAEYFIDVSTMTKEEVLEKVEKIMKL